MTKLLILYFRIGPICVHALSGLYVVKFNTRFWLRKIRFGVKVNCLIPLVGVPLQTQLWKVPLMSMDKWPCQGYTDTGSEDLHRRERKFLMGYTFFNVRCIILWHGNILQHKYKAIHFFVLKPNYQFTHLCKKKQEL